MRIFHAFLVSLATVTAAWGACEGRDLSASLPADKQAEIDRTVQATPYHSGRIWRAVRGDREVIVIGTFHIETGTHDALLEQIAAQVDGASMIYLEQSRTDLEATRAMFLNDPFFGYDTDGPSLIEQLSPADWAVLADAARARGVPPILIARMRPWFVALTLATPPCLAAQGTDALEGGIDHRIMGMAEAAGIPQASLDSPTVLQDMFAGLDEQTGRDLLKAAILDADPARADAVFATTARLYDQGRIWEIWALTETLTRAEDGLDPAAIDRLMAIQERLMVTERNAKWLARLLAEIAPGKTVIAVGALHLPGETGVLKGLEDAGYTLGLLYH